MDRGNGALRAHHDRQTKPVLIAMGLIFLVVALIGLILGVLA